MNSFANTQNSAGLLKDSYDPGDSPIMDALRVRRKRAADKITVPTKDDLEKNEEEQK